MCPAGNKKGIPCGKHATCNKFGGSTTKHFVHPSCPRNAGGYLSAGSIRRSLALILNYENFVNAEGRTGSGKDAMHFGQLLRHVAAAAGVSANTPEVCTIAFLVTIFSS